MLSKPRISFSVKMSLWYCTGGRGNHGVGITPGDAYLDWEFRRILSNVRDPLYKKFSEAVNDLKVTQEYGTTK